MRAVRPTTLMTTVGCIDPFYFRLYCSRFYFFSDSIGHDVQDFVLLQPIAKGPHCSRRAAIDDLKHAFVGRKAGIVMRVLDEARAYGWRPSCQCFSRVFDSMREQPQACAFVCNAVQTNCPTLSG